MHPQTLRIYEQRGLITPKRSPKGTRLYSQDDVERLRRIQELTGEMGMNLAGVERVFELEQQIERMRAPARAAASARPRRSSASSNEEIARVRKSFKAELVPYTGPKGRDLVPVRPRPSRPTGSALRDPDRTTVAMTAPERSPNPGSSATSRSRRTRRSASAAPPTCSCGRAPRPSSPTRCAGRGRSPSSSGSCSAWARTS